MRYEVAMSLVRLVARPLLASKFIVDGVDHVRHPGVRTDAVAPLVDKLAERTQVPNDAELFVRANGAAMAGAGVLLAIGKMQRLSALVLATTALPATFGDHAFWSETDPDVKRAKRKEFLTNLGLIGGVLIAAVDTQGRPGLAWRGEHAVKDAKRSAKRAKKEAGRVKNLAKKDAKFATAVVKREAEHAAKNARREAKRAARDARREAQLAKAKVEAAVA